MAEGVGCAVGACSVASARGGGDRNHGSPLLLGSGIHQRSISMQYLDSESSILTTRQRIPCRRVDILADPSVLLESEP